MPERPLLILHPSPPRKRALEKRRAIPRPKFPSRERQLERIGPLFSRLHEIISRDDPQAFFQVDPTGLAPERALVFEVAGNIIDFINCARRINLDFLGEIESELDPDDDFYKIDEEGRPLPSKITSRLYVAMPDLQALTQILSLWKRFQNNEEFDHGYSGWKNLFSQLYELRPWGHQDRLTPSFMEQYKSWCEREDGGPFRFEIDFWYYENNEKRLEAKAKIKEILNAYGGQIIDQSVIEEIRYDGILAEIPALAKEILKKESHIKLSLNDSVMYLNPQAMSIFSFNEPSDKISYAPLSPGNQPIAALLDGYPFGGHDLLKNRIDIDDFLNVESKYQALQRQHGTAMASLIIHGDLHKQDVPIKSRLLCLPVMVPALQLHVPDWEILLPDKLVVDTIYRAVKRIKEGDGNEGPIGAEVVIINHSMADSNSPYNSGLKILSAWGRLLDYLSYRYKILFIVSAGNYRHKIKLPCSFTEFDNASDADKEKLYYKALIDDMANRQVMPPGESLNPVVVGAWQRDEAPSYTLPGVSQFKLINDDGPSILTPLGPGHLKSIKPDIFYDAGAINSRYGGSPCELMPQPQNSKFYGQKTAFPSSTGETNITTNACGTSNAAALITRKAIQLQEILHEIAVENSEASVPLDFQAVVLKALLVHGCNWDREWSEKLNSIVEPLDSHKWAERRTSITKMAGFGRPDLDRVKECTRQRATLFGWGSIMADQSVDFVLPLPQALSNLKEMRRVTVTLAWISPINPRHQQYKKAALEISLKTDLCGAYRCSLQPPTHTINHGTVLHNYYEGDKRIEIPSGLTIIITCKGKAGTLDEQVPYAVVVSFEVGENSDIDVYGEIKQKLDIQARAKVQI